MNSTHGKQGPLHTTLQPPAERQPSYSRPLTCKSPDFAGEALQKQWLLAQISKVAALPAFWFQGFLHHFLLLMSVVWHRNHCYFSLSARPSYNHSPWCQGISPTLTLLQLNWLYSRETIVEGRGKCVFHVVFGESWKTLASWKVLFSLKTDCVFSSKPDRGLSLGDCLGFCGLRRRTFALKWGCASCFVWKKTNK